MARFGFVGPSYSSQSLNADAQKCLNWYPERNESGGGKSDWQLLPTPGMKLFVALNGQPVRGIIHFTGRTFAVAGETFYEFYSDGTVVNRGTVLNDGLPVSRAAGQGAGGPGYILLASGGALYSFTLSTNTFAQVAAPTNIGLVGYSDGYFIAVERFSNKFYISGLLDATSWNLSDASRISVFSGNIITMQIDHREILFGGSEKGVAYFNSGAALFPFEPNLSAYIEQGAAAQFGSTLLDNTVFWWGADERGQGIAWKIQGYAPVRVSNHAVEYDVQRFSRMDDAISYSYQEFGHAFWVTYFPSANKTWVYDAATGLWHERGYLEINGTISAHRSQCHAFAWGKHLVGDTKSGNVYEMSVSLLDDFGNSIRRVRRSPYVTAEMERIFFHELEVEADAGLGPEVPLTEMAVPETVILKDASGGLWQVLVSSIGLLLTTAITGVLETGLTLSDPAGTTSWELGVTTGGRLTTTSVSFSADNPISLVLGTQGGSAPWALSVTAAGLLQTQPAGSLPSTQVPRGPRMMLRWSDDGARTWSDIHVRDAGQLGEYRTRLRWLRLGSCLGTRGRVFEISVSDAIPWRIVDAHLKATPGFGSTERMSAQLRKGA